MNDNHTKHPLSQALINDIVAKFGSDVLAAHQQGALEALRKVLTVEFSFGDRTGWLDDLADEYGGWGEDDE